MKKSYEEIAIMTFFATTAGGISLSLFPNNFILSGIAASVGGIVGTYLINIKLKKSTIKKLLIEIKKNNNNNKLVDRLFPISFGLGCFIWFFFIIALNDEIDIDQYIPFDFLYAFIIAIGAGFIGTIVYGFLCFVFTLFVFFRKK